MKRLEGKVAIVTGSTSGIGIGIARVFAREGATVVVCGRRAERGVEVVEELVAAGGTASYHFVDLTKIETVKELIDDTAATYGRLDILVNNAANVGLADGSVEELTLEMWDAIFQSDLRGTFYAIKSALPHMRAAGGGSIINMSSVVGVSGNAGQCNYSASKAGMIGLAKSIAKEMGPRGIRANCIAPGFIITDMTDKLPDSVKEEWYKQIPLRRGGTPEDVAKVALFLASDLSSYVSGQVIHCCGAMNC